MAGRQKPGVAPKLNRSRTFRLIVGAPLLRPLGHERLVIGNPLFRQRFSFERTDFRRRRSGNGDLDLMASVVAAQDGINRVEMGMDIGHSINMVLATLLYNADGR